jgi:hypothetical protein
MTQDIIELETDYLIIGSGAVGMAFADIIIEDSDKKIIIVDQYAKPGGHWNAAYPFVTLHQPSRFYGVSSRELSQGLQDKIGLNKGLGDLATGPEILAYFDHVMRHQFLPTGRASYFPLCHYAGEGCFSHKISGQSYRVKAAKIVDATHLKTSVPSTHKPQFKIDDGVTFMPLNELVNITTPPEGFVVIGAGKTGIDACLYLLELGVDPRNIRWIMPRDGWLLNRKNTQPDPAFFEFTLGAQAGQFEAIAAATSIEDMFSRLEACGYFLRLDKNVRPTMFHGATISELELEALQSLLPNIIRMGRVTHIKENEIILDGGVVPTSSAIVHVDCSARAVMNEEIKPIFQGDLITPQMIRSYQPVFSAAFIAHAELTRATEAEKNDVCGVVPLPNHDTDYIRFTHATMMNQYKWGQDKELRKWLVTNRLDGFSAMVANVKPEETEKREILSRLRQAVMPAGLKLTQFLQQI